MRYYFRVGFTLTPILNIKVERKKISCTRFEVKGEQYGAEVWIEKATGLIVQQKFKNGALIRKASREKALASAPKATSKTEK